MFIRGVGPRVWPKFNLHVPDSTPTHYDDRFADILHRSSDSATRHYASTPRTPMSSTVSSALTLTTCRLVRTKHNLKDTSGHKHSPIGSGYLQATIVSPSRIYRDHSFLALRASGSWIPTRLWLRSSTRSVPTPCAQHANPLSKPVLCVHRFAPSHPEHAIDPAQRHVGYLNLDLSCNLPKIASVFVALA